MTATDADLTAADVVWDLGPLLPAPGDAGLDELLDAADARGDELAQARGKVHDFDADALAAFMNGLAALHDLVGRAGSFAGLDFATDTTDPARGARMQQVEERTTVISTKLLFFELEWAEFDDERVDTLLADERLAFARHHLRSARRYRPHLLTEPEEVMLTEKAITGRSAFERLFDEQVSAITVELDGRPTTLEAGAGATARARPRRPPHRGRGRHEGLEPGLRTRGFVLNTLLADKSVDDRLRHFDTVDRRAATSRTRPSDESVQALVEAVQGRNSIPQRWYTLKARLLGIDRLADYDRMASVADVESADRLARREGARARRVRVVLRRARRHRAALLRRLLDRRAGAAGQAPRRVLRVHRPVAPPVRVAELDVAAPRRARRSRTSSGTGCTRTSRAGRASSTSRRRSRWPRPRRCSARRSRSAGCSKRSPTRTNGSRCSRRTSRTRSRRCSARSR